MGKEFDMFEDLFTDKDFKIDDEEENQEEMMDTTDPDDEDLDVDESKPNPGNPSPSKDACDGDCDTCGAPDGSHWDTGKPEKVWDTKPVWKPKTWKT